MCYSSIVASVCIACEEIRPDDEITRDGMCRKCWSFIPPAQRTPLGNRERRLKWTYGLEYKDYASMYAHQNGQCMICCKKIAKYKGKDGVEVACVDHDHESGQVRGLLCRSCNVGLGHFRDDPLLLDAAIEYLIEND